VESVQLHNAQQTALARPSWICISEAAKEESGYADLGSLLAQFRENASVE
jgi:hypothetical protein